MTRLSPEWIEIKDGLVRLDAIESIMYEYDYREPKVTIKTKTGNILTIQKGQGSKDKLEEVKKELLNPQWLVTDGRLDFYREPGLEELHPKPVYHHDE